MRSEPVSLPHPTRKRWQPLRSGFVNLYRYDREEFHFENGRLLLRGNNGTGKSRVLALQLPFLLDGDVSPHRLEPDADPSKKVEWNLLMDRYADRTGYTWIEFGRCEDEGDPNSKEHYLTLGCGLSAVEGKAGVRQWFFISTQRIGCELELVSDSKQVLGKDRLRERIGRRGQVFESAGAYRRVVNELLFGLDEYRYASLVNLLIQLRRPQLTRRLEEQELSRALSEAMPPVSPVVLANVAEAFRSLEADRNGLSASKTAGTAVERFLNAYRAYAQAAAKRRADRVLAAHLEYDSGMKDILTAEAECDRSVAELARLKAEMQRLSDEEHALHAEIAAFQQNPQTKDAHAVQQAQREANERRHDAESAASEWTDASQVNKRCADEHAQARKNLEYRETQLAEATTAALQAASSAGLEQNHRETLATLDGLAATRAIDAAVQKQSEKALHAETLNERLSAARRDVQRASIERDQLAGLLTDARERLNAAREAHQTSITTFLEAIADWTAGLTELPLPFDEVFLRSVSRWCDTPNGPNPFAIATRKAVDDLIKEFADVRAQLAVQIELDPTEAIDELNRREETLRREADGAPADEGVRTAHDYALAVARHMDGLRKRFTEAEASVSQKQARVAELSEQRSRELADLGIAARADDLPSLKDSIAQYRIALSSLWAAMESLQAARVASERAWRLWEEATAREERYKEIAERLERQAVAAEIARDAAGQAAGASYSEVLERIDRARRRLEELRMEEKEIRNRYHDTEVAVTRVDERLRNRTEMLNGQTDRRETAASSLRTLVATGMLELVTTGIADATAVASSTTRTVELAFDLVSRLDAIDGSDAAWERHQKAMPSEFNTLMQTLSIQGCPASATFRDDLFIATVTFAGREHTVAEFQQFLLQDVRTRQELLEARQREILENHLVGSVSAHLRELLEAAEEQVRQMNAELESRPMSTGMKLRFAWRPAEDAPIGMTEARQRLMQIGVALSPADRESLGAFLQQQIQAVCSDNEGGSWQESLAQALDYRKWHRFVVERYQDGVWKRLTARTYGTGSGGEKAVALTLPHFAAAAAFYRSADELAPRLIMLDEAFVGIDADMRGKCMGLIHTFDLDFIMTSEREWGCYPTLPGIAIYQLSTRPGIDAVGLTRWVWNGRQRTLLHNMDSEENAVYSTPHAQQT